MSDSTRQAAPPRFPLVTVACLVFDAQGRILLLRSRKWAGRYGLPAGKVEFGETLRRALKRELMEETGLALSSASFLCTQELVFPREFFLRSHFLSFAYLCRAAPGVVRLNHEASSFRWEHPERAFRLALNEPTRKLLSWFLRRTSALAIRNLRAKCRVGVTAAERRQRQELLLTVKATVQAGAASFSDALSDTVDYSSLARQILSLLRRKAYGLLESLAEEVAGLVLSHPRVLKVRVAVKKPGALRQASSASVTLARSRPPLLGG